MILEIISFALIFQIFVLINPMSSFPILMEAWRKKMNVRIGLPATKWMLNIGAFFIRTEAELVLKSRNVIPQKAINEGFVFKFPKFIDCINHLIT